jgi:hypothetical protein
MFKRIQLENRDLFDPDLDPNSVEYQLLELDIKNFTIKNFI